jgi:ABC-type multidrug transport system fused ATPase/permease subunit
VKADYIYVMDSGTIVEQGSYNHLKDLEKGVFSKMLEKQTM